MVSFSWKATKPVYRRRTSHYIKKREERNRIYKTLRFIICQVLKTNKIYKILFGVFLRKLSVLIFSNEDSKNLNRLIDNIYNIADEIVLIDSSKILEYINIKNSLKGKKKITFYRTLAFGYPDPLRMWGLKKCKYNWVLYMDTDEIISNQLKKDIKNIISKNKVSAYTIKRYEKESDYNSKVFFTWQTRLFDKTKVVYKGLLHESPIVNGKIEVLTQGYYIRHFQSKTKRNYNKLRVFDLTNYSKFNVKLKVQISKIVKNKILINIIYYFITLPQKFVFKKENEQISTYDYFWYLFLENLAYSVASMNILNIIFGIPYIKRNVNFVDEFSRKNGKEKVFNISNTINEIGIIKYLRLDEDRIVNKFYKKYEKKKQGTNLLIKMILDNYDNYFKKL